MRHFWASFFYARLLKKEAHQAFFQAISNELKAHGHDPYYHQRFLKNLQESLLAFAGEILLNHPLQEHLQKSSKNSLQQPLTQALIQGNTHAS